MADLSAREQAVQRFRKKPVVIETMRWVGSATGATPIIDWVLDGEGTARYHEEECMYSACPDGEHIVIDTLEGNMTASPGDWIIKGVAGEFYPCRSDIFEATYEEVVDGEGPDLVPEVRGGEAS
jgi:hypothetical protein